MKIEHLKEGWVNFTRYSCKEGFIDTWVGDSVNNPNNKEKSNINLNSFASYYRLNEGKWVNRQDLFRLTQLEPVLSQLAESCTATEIWETYKNK